MTAQSPLEFETLIAEVVQDNFGTPKVVDETRLTLSASDAVLTDADRQGIADALRSRVAAEARMEKDNRAGCTLFHEADARLSAPVIVTHDVASRATLSDLRCLVSEAYLSLFSRLPEDHVVVDSLANQEFIARCRALGACGPESELNQLLFNLRKAGKHSGIDRKKPAPLDPSVKEAVSFASEISARLVSLEVEQSSGAPAALDRVLCNPTLRRQFDALCLLLSPGFDERDYRLAALAARKDWRRRSKLVSDAPIPRFHSLKISSINPAARLPDEPGVYMIMGEKQCLYVGKALDLRSRVDRHFGAGGTALIPASVGLFDMAAKEICFSAGEALSKSGMRSEIRDRFQHDRNPVLNFSSAA